MDRLVVVLRSILSQSFAWPFSAEKIQVSSILLSIAILLAALLVSRHAQRVLSNRVFPRFRIQLAPNSQFLIMRLVNFVIVLIAVLMVLSVLQIQLTGLAIVFGFLSVGIGFGLQNITSNFISGIILLFERPIRVGDRITIGDTIGVIQAINIRATHINTPDNIDVIVPNSQFIEQMVINWSLKDTKIRIRVPVGVAYGSDTRLVKRILLEVAQAQSEVLKQPEPIVRFLRFGDSSLDFELLAWIPDGSFRLDITSDLNFAIDHAFREHDVTIPFPQRDVHVLHSG